MATLLEYVGNVHIYLGPYRGNPIALYLKRNGDRCVISPKVYPWNDVVGVGETPNKAAADFEDKWKAKGLSPEMYAGPSWEGGIKPDRPKPAPPPKPAAAAAPAGAAQPGGTKPAQAPPKPAGSAPPAAEPAFPSVPPSAPSPVGRPSEQDATGPAGSASPPDHVRPAPPTAPPPADKPAEPPPRPEAPPTANSSDEENRSPQQH